MTSRCNGDVDREGRCRTCLGDVCGRGKREFAPASCFPTRVGGQEAGTAGQSKEVPE